MNWVAVGISIAAFAVALWAAVTAHKAFRLNEREAARGHVQLVNAESHGNVLSLRNEGKGEALVTEAHVWLQGEESGRADKEIRLEWTIGPYATEHREIDIPTTGCLVRIYHRPVATPKAKPTSFTVRVIGLIPIY